jgi:phosphatidate cytidylyltransferase
MMHLRRWLTSIVAIPILLFTIGPGPRWLFCSLVSFVSLVALYEYLQITSPRLPRAVTILSFTLCLGLTASAFRSQLSLTLGLYPLGMFLLWGVHLFFYDSEESHSIIEDLGKIALGFIYICLPLSLLVVIDRQPQGNMWIFFLIVVVFAGDTGAFYSGRFLGKHKLYPAVSPAKTWEGSAGGFVASLIAALLFSLLSSLKQPVLAMLVLGACLSVTDQVGDLSESMIKRAYGVKNSGTILPGHGGMLDRIDGLLFSVPILYLSVS